MNPDDPKFTAYALDELDPAERAEIEQLLRDDPAAEAEVAETRAFAAQLRARLHAEPGDALRAEQRAEVLASVAPERAPRNLIAFSRKAAAWSALAACAAFGIGLALLLPALQRWEGNRVGVAVNSPKPRDGSEVRIQLNPPPAEANEWSSVNDTLTLHSPEVREVSKTTPAPTLTIASAHISQLGRPWEEGGKNPVADVWSADPAAIDLAKFSKQRVADAGAGAQSTMLAADGDTLAGANVILQPPSEPTLEVVRAKVRPEYSVSLGRGGAVAGTARGVGSAGATLEDKLRIDALLAHRTATVAGLKSADGESAEARYYRDVPNFLPPAQPSAESLGTEAYNDPGDNAFLKVVDAPLSTFSIDVDTASYANVRRFLNNNQLPPKAAVRIEEMLNYFSYDYPQPEGDAPFSAAMEVATCPWQPEHRLLRVGLKGREIQRAARPPSNLVFLIDVSGSMQPENKLPLLKRSLQLLVDQLGERDQVSIVVYAGAAGCVLEPTRSKEKIRAALDRLESGGSTAGSEGLQQAYQLADRAFIKGGTNRVILATDGDWNVGITDKESLWSLIERKAKGGVFLTVLGFGMDNLKDDMLEQLADKGNGNYAYIDTLNEGRKVLVDELGATLVTIAKDVKIQIEFNPAQVAGYRLIGYENRVLAAKDFADDTKDAGEIGAGHSVTALYELIPAGKDLPRPAVEALKYQAAPASAVAKDPEVKTQKPEFADELLTLKLRFKAPDGDTSTLREFPLKDGGKTFANASRDFRFAAAVASYGMLLRGSPHKGGSNWGLVHELAVEGKGDDRTGYRTEFVGLVERARALSR